VGNTRRVPLGESRRQTIEKKIDRPCRLRLRRGGSCGLGRVHHSATIAEATGENRRRECFEVGLARKGAIQRLESFRSSEQQRGSVASASEREGDLRPKPF
jgi:hypothetical protein